MKLRLLLPLMTIFSTLIAAEIPAITPAAAAKLVEEGKAVLVDVREPSEWAESGVAAPALLLAKGQFDAGRAGGWKELLASLGDKEIILYCRSGRRAGVIGGVLTAEGYKVANAGGFKDWQAAGLPVKPVAPAQK